MVARMKTTVEIDDQLLTRAKEAARRRKTTLRRLIEQGLRHELSQKPKAKPYRMKDVSVGGGGLLPGVDLSDPDQFLRAAYGDRLG